MLKKYLIIISVVVSIILASIDFFLFSVNPGIAFYIHNALALLVGVSLVFLSFKLIRKNNLLDFFILIVGISMIVNHLVKLIIGNCT